MPDLTSLLDVIPQVPQDVQPEPKAEIHVAACPEPYVAPKYHLQRHTADEDLIAAELVFVSAPRRGWKKLHCPVYFLATKHPYPRLGESEGSQSFFFWNTRE